MLAATPELEAFLNSTTQGVCLPILTITLRDGTALRWALHKSDVSFGGTTWLAHGKGGRPLILSYHWRRPVGLEEVGTCEVALGTNETSVLGSERLQIAAARGAFKGARLLVEEAYAETLTSPIIGKLYCWSGKIQSAPGDSHGTRLVAESVVADLKATMLPKTLLTAPCGNALFDPACGVSRATHTFTRSVGAGATKNAIPLTGADADGEWDGGTLTVAGEKRGVRSFTGGVAELSHPLPSAPAGGVSVTVTRGCDRTPGPGGCAKFANFARFRGVQNLPKEG